MADEETKAFNQLYFNKLSAGPPPFETIRVGDYGPVSINVHAKSVWLQQASDCGVEPEICEECGDSGVDLVIIEPQEIDDIIAALEKAKAYFQRPDVQAQWEAERKACEYSRQAIRARLFGS